MRMAALQQKGSEEFEALLYIKCDGVNRGWRLELLTEQISNKVEQKLLLCSYCRGLVREACQCEINGKHVLRCLMCKPFNVGLQPAPLTREAINEKSICCPLKQKGCNWADSVTTVINHLNKCGFLSVSCPLNCVLSEGDRKGEVIKVERRLIPEHKGKWCPQRSLDCEYCNKGAKACEMNSHLDVCEMFPVKCPNSCIITGTGTRLMKRGIVSAHLSHECPLEIVKCPFWDEGCRERMERRLIPRHKSDSCLQRELKCKFCNCGVKACEMDPHLDVCELFPVKCPNGCIVSGNTGIRHVSRGNLSPHLTDECPLQILKCPYWDYGCREEMERQKLDFHERDSIHIHFKLSLSEAKEIKLRQVESSNKILVLEEANCSKDLEIKQLKKAISTLIVESCRTDWTINGIRERITMNKISVMPSYSYSQYHYSDTCFYREPFSYSNPFYIGQYKCQCKIVWSHATSKSKIGLFISVVKGKFDEALRWPFMYQVKFKLHNQTMKGNNYTWSHRVSEEDLQRFPECFQRPTKVRNRAFGVASFISNNELLTEKYCKADAISISISVKQLPVL